MKYNEYVVVFTSIYIFTPYPFWSEYYTNNIKKLLMMQFLITFHVSHIIQRFVSYDCSLNVQPCSNNLRGLA